MPPPLRGLLLLVWLRQVKAAFITFSSMVERRNATTHLPNCKPPSTRGLGQGGGQHSCCCNRQPCPRRRACVTCMALSWGLLQHSLPSTCPPPPPPSPACPSSCLPAWLGSLFQAKAARFRGGKGIWVKRAQAPEDYELENLSYAQAQQKARVVREGGFGVFARFLLFMHACANKHRTSAQ